MDLGKVPKQRSEWESMGDKSRSNIAEIASVVLGIQKKKIKIKQAKIKHIAKGLSEIAYSMGETNDPDAYAEDMTNEIMLSLKEVQDREEKQEKKRKQSEI